jgi:hypothetical protein
MDAEGDEVCQCESRDLAELVAHALNVASDNKTLTVCLVHPTSPRVDT